MNITQTYQIYKNSGFKDKDMRRAFHRESTPTVVAGLIEELAALKAMLPEIKANAIVLAANSVNGIDTIKYDDLIAFAESVKNEKQDGSEVKL